jgi:F-type H+-transporting ATPase subunit a
MFTVIITPFLHLYFDLFDAGVQALVFTMLTFSYWSQAMGDENVGALIDKKIKTKGREWRNSKRAKVATLKQ